MQTHNKICKLPVSVCDRRSVLKGCNQKVSHEKGHNRKRATFCLRVPLVPSSYVLDKTDYRIALCTCYPYLSWRSYFLFLSKATFDIFCFLGDSGGPAAFLFIAHGYCCQMPAVIRNQCTAVFSFGLLSATLSHFRLIIRSISVASFRVDFKNTEQERSHSKYCAEIVQALIEGVRLPMARHNISCKI